MNEMDIKSMVCIIVGILVLGAVLLSPAACTMNRHRIVSEAIKSGIDPVAAKCAIEADTGHTPQCLAHTLKGQR